MPTSSRKYYLYIDLQNFHLLCVEKLPQAKTERELNNIKFVAKTVIIWFLSLNNIRDDEGIVPYDKKYIRHICFLKTKKLKQASI